MKEIIIATRNQGKAEEFASFFGLYGIQVKTLLDLDKNLPDVEETGTTFEENAKIKASEIAALLKQPVLADDSGLVVDALNGAPGIYSARYAGEEKNDEKNNIKLLEKLQGVPMNKRTARFVCVLAISVPGEDIEYFKGYCEGTIARQAKGNNGFGYDPLFIPEGYSKTMAELTADEKNSISHRNQAFQSLKKWEKLSRQD
jgi:XTP/dITP diphosphohydrolase